MTKDDDRRDRAELDALRPAARRAAARASADPLVVDAAENFALAQYLDHRDVIAPAEPARRRWVEVVARNHARRLATRLHREVAFGRAGSLIPPTADDVADAALGRLIADMHLAGARSLGSLIASKMEFDRRWALLSPDHRWLLEAKHIDERSSKDIAAERGTTAGTVDNQLTRARQALRLLFADFFHDAG